MKTKTIQLIVFRNFSIEVPDKKTVESVHKIANEYISENFPEVVKDGYDTIQELIYATAVEEAIYRQIAKVKGFKINYK